MPRSHLTDINLPGMNGYECLKILKDNDQLRHIPVIALTANAMPYDIEKGRKAGFDGYLTKPLNIPHFLQTIDNFHPTRKG